MTFNRVVATVVGLAICLVLAWSSGASAVKSFSTASLKGRYVYHLDPATSFGGTVLGDAGGVTAAPRQNVMRVGYIDWDGLGNILNARAFEVTDDNNGNTIVIDFVWTGTYTVNADGTGTLTVATATATDASCTPAQLPGICATLVGAPETYNLVVSKRYSSVSLVETDNSGGAKIFLNGEAIRQFRVTTPFFFTTASLSVPYKFRLGPATSFAAIAPGDPGGVAAATRQDIMRVGFFAFNGLGNLNTSAVRATTDDNTGSTVVINFNSIGTYTMNSDGTGTITLTPAVNDTSCTPPQLPGVCATFEPAPQTFVFALSKSTQQMFLMGTNTAPDPGAKIFLFGNAQAQ